MKKNRLILSGILLLHGRSQLFLLRRTAQRRIFLRELLHNTFRCRVAVLHHIGERKELSALTVISHSAFLVVAVSPSQIL